MNSLRPLVCAAASAACCLFPSLRADTGYRNGTAVVTQGDATASLDTEVTLDQLQYQSDLDQAIRGEKAAPHQEILGNSTLSYRLDIFGDIFSDQEKAMLSTGTKLLSSARLMARDMQPNRAWQSDRAVGGAAYARGISTSILTTADQTGDVWAPLTSWSVPGGTFRGAMGNQLAPIVWDYSEQSRGSGFGGATFLEKAVVLLPGGGSIATQLGVAELKVTFQCLVTGRWPTFSHMENMDYEKFCKIWAKRIANVALANYVSSLMIPKPTGRPAGSAARLHSPPPVTLNYRF